MSLFVGNISHGATPRDVEDMFMKFGNCRVDLKRGFAFIDYDDERDAEDALRDLQGQDLNGMRINVEWSKRHIARRGMGGGGGRFDRDRRGDDRRFGGGYNRDYRDRDFGRRDRDYGRGGGRNWDSYGRDRGGDYHRDADRFRDRDRDRDRDYDRRDGDYGRSRRNDRDGDYGRGQPRDRGSDGETGGPRRNEDAGWKRPLENPEEAQGDSVRRRTEDREGDGNVPGPLHSDRSPRDEGRETNGDARSPRGDRRSPEHGRGYRSPGDRHGDRDRHHEVRREDDDDDPRGGPRDYEDDGHDEPRMRSDKYRLSDDRRSVDDDERGLGANGDNRETANGASED